MSHLAIICKRVATTGEGKTVYALQEFFIGQWDDWKVIENKEQALAEYRTFKNTHYRDTRLVERTETILSNDTVRERYNRERD
jgi:hypothetical protein